MLEQSSKETNPLVICYGLLSACLHLQRLPRAIGKQERFVREVAVGEAHCLMLMGDHSVYGVGSNEFGQLGLQKDEADQASEFIEQLTLIELRGFSKRNAASKNNTEVT